MEETAKNPAKNDLYNVRFISTHKLRRALKNEQIRRYQATGKLTPVMLIACELLETKAFELDGTPAG